MLPSTHPKLHHGAKPVSGSPPPRKPQKSAGRGSWHDHPNPQYPAGNVTPQHCGRAMLRSRCDTFPYTHMSGPTAGVFMGSCHSRAATCRAGGLRRRNAGGLLGLGAGTRRVPGGISSVLPSSRPGCLCRSIFTPHNGGWGARKSATHRHSRRSRGLCGLVRPPWWCTWPL